MSPQMLQDLQAAMGIDVLAFLPELILAGAVVLMLLLRLVPKLYPGHLGWGALVFTFVALVVSWSQWNGVAGYDPRADMNPTPGFLPMFSGMLVYDNFTIFLRLFLLGFVFLVILLSLLTGIPDSEDSADFYVLLLGSTIGMSLMASANHLMMIFLAVEMASLPSYVLAGFLKGRRASSEAALKYVVYGGGAAGIMLYGMSLLAGTYGTGYVPDLVKFIGQGPIDPMVMLGILFVLIGVGFKLAAFPFHFWCPDVFEGAAAEVGAFLSVASKGAALALLTRITLGLAGLGLEPNPDAWVKVAPYLVPALALFAALTTTFGNLAAYKQTNLKRLLAYSTIAHAGFMLMGLAPLSRVGAGAVLFYLVVYLFMNLGAFAIVAFLRNLTGSEDLRDFRGLIHRNPLLVITFGFFLLSLLGLPPLGGFIAKFQILAALVDGAQEFAQHDLGYLSTILYALLVVGGLNTVLSLFYYVKVLKVMVIDKPLEVVENRPVEPLTTPFIPNLYVALLAAVVLGLGIFWGTVSTASNETGVQSFQAAPGIGLGVQAKGAQP